jgi:hypothetical protein
VVSTGVMNGECHELAADRDQDTSIESRVDTCAPVSRVSLCICILGVGKEWVLSSVANKSFRIIK